MNVSLKKLSFALLLCLFPVASSSAGEIPSVAPADAAKQVEAGKAVLVDVREPDEWAASGVAAPAILLAKSDLENGSKAWKEFLTASTSKRIILYCRSGTRAGKVAEDLAKQGREVANAGAFSAWKAAGLPVREAKAAE